MRVPKKYLIYSLFLIFFSFFFVNNSYAVDDRVVYITQNQNYQLCDGNSGYNCSDYNYLIVEIDFVGASVGSDNFQIPLTLNGLNSSFYIPLVGYASPYTVFSFNGLARNIRTQSSYLLGVSLEQGSTYKLTLTENSPIQSCPELPSGSITLSSNGIYDVTSYAEAVVDVPATVIQGDYHDDLVRIYKAIMTCGAVVLVLYFFYCIYRMIIKSTGGKQ